MPILDGGKYRKYVFPDGMIFVHETETSWAYPIHVLVAGECTYFGDYRSFKGAYPEHAAAIKGVKDGKQEE